jgi:ATP-dependent RNA helicase DDX18/HAS1
MDPDQAAKLRKLMKAKGSSAVVDKRGFVRQDVLETDAADEPGSSSGRQRRTAGAGTSSIRGSASRVAEPAAETAEGREPGRSRLFDTSQLQAAVPGSGGAIAALPIVRPASTAGPRPGSVTSPDRAAVAAAAAAAKSRAGAASASGFYTGSSWRELGASQQVQDAVAAIGISRPSHVQAEAYKALSLKSGFRHVALADQAGSGKTLAYLLPLLQQLKEREERLGEPATTPNSPSIIILTPTTGEEVLC